MFQAKGYYRSSGTRSATQNLQHQLPLIATEFPEIADFYRGTINVRFEPKLIVAGWDHRTPAIQWDSHQPEVFDLVRVRLRFEGLPDKVTAIWYVAHRSSHRSDPHKHEFVAERFVPGLREGGVVYLECTRDNVELPYEEQVRGGGNGPRLARTIVVL